VLLALPIDSPCLALAASLVPACVFAQPKPAITLDEYFNTTEITAVRLSPNGCGDDFMLAIQPHIVSAPGRDILAGVE